MCIAIPHMEGRILGRSGGYSALNSVAYGLCTELTNTLTGEQTRDYSEKKGFVSSFTLAPEYAPSWMYDPVQLASFIDKMEPRKDSQLLREFIISMPCELSHEQQQALARELVASLFVARGMIGMVFLHDEKTGNPHAHTLLTMRTLNEDGTFGKKCRDWNSWGNMKEWREKWAEIVNSHLEQAGSSARIDHRSYEEQNSGQVPLECLSRAECEMEKRGHHTTRGDRNREIRTCNLQKQALLDEITAEWEATSQRVVKQATLKAEAAHLVHTVIQKATVTVAALHLKCAALVDAAQKTLQAHALTPREMETHPVSQVRQRQAGEKVAHPDTLQIIATLKKERGERQEEFSRQSAQVGKSLEQQAALLDALLEKIATTRTKKPLPEALPESIMQQIADLPPEKEEEKTRHPAVLQRLELYHQRRGREEGRADYYAEEARWPQSETRRQYDKSQRHTKHRTRPRSRQLERTWHEKQLLQGIRHVYERVLPAFIDYAKQWLPRPPKPERAKQTAHMKHARPQKHRQRRIFGAEHVKPPTHIKPERSMWQQPEKGHSP